MFNNITTKTQMKWRPSHKPNRTVPVDYFSFKYHSQENEQELYAENWMSTKFPK